MASVTNEASAPASRPLLDPKAHTTSRIVPFSASAERFEYIDVLRGLAVVLMVEQHLGIWLTAVYRVRGGLLPLVMGINALGGAAAPLFVFLAGVSAALGTQLADSAFLRRGLALGLCGFLLNLACPSWFSPGSYYVLHLIACFWLLVPGLRRLSAGWLLVLFVVVLVLTLGVQTWLRTPPLLTNDRLRDTSLSFGVLRLALAEGHFPLLPWLAFALLGSWAGRKIKSGALGQLFPAAAILLTAFVVLRLPRLLLRPRQLRQLPLRSLVDVSFYPASVAFVLLLAGICLLLLALARHWDGHLRLVRPWLLPLGRTSLTLLCLHVVVFREGSRALGYFQRVEPIAVLLVIAAVLSGWALLARAWARADYRYSLEWWLRRAGGRARVAIPGQDLPR